MNKKIKGGVQKRIREVTNKEIVKDVSKIKLKEKHGLLPSTSAQLNLDVVLLNGQSFRWKKYSTKDSENTFIGVARQNVWKLWRINPEQIAFIKLATFALNETQNDTEILKDYFQLNVNLEELYLQWSSNDTFFKEQFDSNSSLLGGIRILKQNLLETIFAFICSANNNILRISKMVEELCKLYGTPSSEIMINTSETKSFYNFPSLEQMQMGLNTMEQQLRTVGFGYRAAYIASAVQKIVSFGGQEWLDQLHSLSYKDAKTELLKIPGVGPKVSDCVCLMGLQKHHVVPVDTHVFNLTKQVYSELLILPTTKTITKSMHDEIGKFYVAKFGTYAGWAHSILFSARLTKFKNQMLLKDEKNDK